MWQFGRLQHCCFACFAVATSAAVLRAAYLLLDASSFSCTWSHLPFCLPATPPGACSWSRSRPWPSCRWGLATT